MSTMTFLSQQQEVASRLRLTLTNAEQMALVKRWINQSQQEIWGRYDWPWALEREIVQTVVDKTAGTVSVGAGGQAVTGASTAFTSADVGKFIQFSGTNDWYKVSAVGSSLALTIEAPYVGTSALSAGTYTLRKVFYNVSSSVEKVLDIRQASSPRKLTLVPYRKFDQYQPNPEATSSPSYMIPWGYDSSNRWLFSVYPTPSEILNLEVRFKKKATDMSADADVSAIPEKWHSTVLLDGALYRGLEHVRTAFDDKRAEIKNQQFERGVAQMIADAEPNSDWHPVIQSREVSSNVLNTLRLPEDFDTR